MVNDPKNDDIADEESKNEVIEMPEETGLENSEEKSEDVGSEQDNKVSEPKKPNIFKKFLGFYKTKKKIAIPLTILLLLAILFGVPVTRYFVLGKFIKADYYVTVVDSVSYKTVSGVTVSLGGQTVTTSRDQLKLRVGVGPHKITAQKKYYKDFSQEVQVPFKQGRNAYVLAMVPTGRQTSVKVINKINGKPVSKTTIKVADTQATTDDNGEVTLSLPPDKETLDATLLADGYNETKVTITVSDEATDKNNFQLVPSGKVYFLSKKTGKIDVVKTDLDGSNRQTVLAGTGQEEDTNTVLLASRDWKFLALQSRREGDKARLYVIDTSNDMLTEIDSGDASFTPAGWHEHNFAYTVFRNNVPIWQAKKSAIKTYNADSKQLTVIDETNAEGTSDMEYAGETLGSIYILKDGLIYTKHWYASYYSVYRLSGKRMGIYKAKPNGTDKQLIKDFDAGNSGYISAAAYEPEEVYFAVYNNSATSYYEYHDGKVVEAKDVTAGSFSKFYPTYLLSPSGQNTFWYEPRDGKNTLFTGNQAGQNGKEIATLSEYIPYGWYSDDYLLVSKAGSELYILPSTGTIDKEQILKITDYHKPATSFAGYGYGYGGQ